MKVHIKEVNDMKPFEHGEEGTHYACNNRIKTEDGKARCCACVPHKNCDDQKPAKKKCTYVCTSNCRRNGCPCEVEGCEHDPAPRKEPRCKSHPDCSHNTNGRDLRKPCSIEFKEAPTDEKELEELKIGTKECGCGCHDFEGNFNHCHQCKPTDEKWCEHNKNIRGVYRECDICCPTDEIVGEKSAELKSNVSIRHPEIKKWLEDLYQYAYRAGQRNNIAELGRTGDDGDYSTIYQKIEKLVSTSQQSLVEEIDIEIEALKLRGQYAKMETKETTKAAEYGYNQALAEVKEILQKIKQ